MAVRRITDKIHNKKLRRRREGLFTKAFEYGELDGVELALFIWYPKRGDFYSYRSADHLPWIHSINDMVGSTAARQRSELAKKHQLSKPKAKNEFPDNVRKRVVEIRRRQKRASPSVMLGDDDGVSGQEDEDIQEVAGAASNVTFPDPPMLKLTILRGRAAAVVSSTQ